MKERISGFSMKAKLILFSLCISVIPIASVTTIYYLNALNELKRNKFPVRKILEENKEMTGVYKDYRGIPVLGVSAYIQEYGWIVLAEIDKAEAFASVRMLGIAALVVGGISGALVITLGIVFSVSMARPISDLKYAAGQSLKMTLSIGVASFPEHGIEPVTLLSAADSALYKAKRGGRNRVEVP